MEFWNDICDIIRIFYGHETIEEYFDYISIKDEDIILIHLITEQNNQWENTSTLFRNGIEVGRYTSNSDAIEKNDPLLYKRYLKRCIKTVVFRLLKNYTKKKVPWGSLTGIRPTKLAHELIEEGKTRSKVISTLCQRYDVEKEKALLLLKTVDSQQHVLQNTSEKDISLYVGIPFCTSRCLYCSFPSYISEQPNILMEQYVTALLKEIDRIGHWIIENGFNLQSVYVGGGTPTALTAHLLSNILQKINSAFSLKQDLEFTVEAGRPDSLDDEKLHVLKEQGVNRISINPQSMNEITLKRIGRNHTPRDIVEIYAKAKMIGFPIINMDIIIGLPEETTSMVERTLEEISKLNPENLTVHTLAIKRASLLKATMHQYQLPSQDTIEDMLDITQNWAKRLNLEPYYLYRQKYMMGNLENVGYCKPGTESIYNIQIMEEKQSIIALGAGAITKWVYPSENRLERIPNVKNISEYISRIDEMITRKIQNIKLTK